MKNIIFSRRNLDFKIVDLKIFSVISELLRFYRASLHIGVSYSEDPRNWSPPGWQNWEKTKVFVRSPKNITGGREGLQTFPECFSRIVET